jgi:plasmid stabilization system protein ParE
MRRVEWATAALNDLQNIRSFFDAEEPTMTQTIIDRIIVSTDWLLDHPQAGPVIGYRRWRKWRPRKTSYLLLYRPTKLGVSVVRIVHARRNYRPRG